MTYNILAINPGHNGSAALVKDGILDVYIEEERLSRFKRDGNPYRAMLKIMDKNHVDLLVIGGTGQEVHRLPWTGDDSYSALVKKFFPQAQVVKMGNEHHLQHAASAFYGSGFDEAVALVVDGCGSLQDIKLENEQQIMIFKDMKQKVYINVLFLVISNQFSKGIQIILDTL